MVLAEMLEVNEKAESCLGCLQRSLTASADEDCKCVVGCIACEAAKAVCAHCNAKGFREWKSDKRRCDHCQLAKKRCVRGRVIGVETDKEAAVMKASKQATGEGGRLWGRCFSIFGIQHALKSAAGPFYNWFFAVHDDVVCVTDLWSLFSQPFRALLSLINKEVLIRKDKHNVELILRLFGFRVSELAAGLVVKTTIYPEVFRKWLAEFQKKIQDWLSSPRSIAVNEMGKLLLVDSDAVFAVKLSNPVQVTLLTGKPTRGAPNQNTRVKLDRAKYVDASGIAFLAQEVAVLCERGDSRLRVIHTDPANGDAVYKVESPYRLYQPSDVATITRLDAVETGRGQKPTATIAVIESGQTTLLILVIEQGSLQLKPYSATRAVRINLTGPARSLGIKQPLRCVATMPLRRVNIGVLRGRRDAAIEAASNRAEEAAARAAFTADSTTSTLVYVTRQGAGGTDSPSSVIEVDVAGVLAGGTIGGMTRTNDRSEKVDLRATKVADLIGRAGPVAVDQNNDVYVTNHDANRIDLCSKSNGTWNVSIYAGSDTRTLRAQPKDGVAAQSSFGSVTCIAAWPCGRGIFGADGISKSVFKIANLDGFSLWATLWRKAYECFGLLDPTRKGESGYPGRHRLWSEILADLESSAGDLRAIHQARCDATGCPTLQGPVLGMDTNSLR